MSLPKVASSKSKDGFVHHHQRQSSYQSGFDRANQMLQELETLIENELAETPQLAATYENIARAKSKRKRNGPYLIRPLNKSKARKTFNDMEFDPVLGIWVGNNEDKKTFGQPALITDKSRTDNPKTYGNMVWDPKEGKWKGNEEDLRKFEHKKVPLISNKKTDNLILKEINGMTFNPATMKWEGNDDALLDFGTISDASPTRDDGFVVGTEFQLTPATTQLFAECAARHIASTSGWWREEKSREHLMVIRTMSIMRVVRDIKRAPLFDEEPADMDIANDREVPLKSPRAEPETDFEDWDEVGPFNGTAKLKLRENMSPLDIDVELEQELNKEDGRKFGSISNRNGKMVVTEDWDNDFEDLSKNLPSKLKTYKGIPNFNNPDEINPSTPPQQITPVSHNVAQQITPQMMGTVTKLGKGGGTLSKRPFELLKSDAPHRRSFHNLHESNKAVKLAWEEEDEEGLEIPAEPLKLKLERAPSVASETDDIIDDEGDDEPALHSPPDEFDDVEVEEEDWGDVEVPTSLGEPVTRRPSQTKPPPQPEKEEWDDLGDIPSKLVLKVKTGPQARAHKSHKNLREDEEEWDGLDIPENAKLQLKR